MSVTPKKQTKLKEHEIKTGTTKKARSKTRQNREKPNFKLFVILKSPEFLKGAIWQQSVMELRYSSPDGGKR